MPLRWMPQAREDLGEIVAYIARDDPDAAERVYRRIFAAASLLIDQPALGRPGRVDGTRELIVSGTKYLLPYRMRGAHSAVDILAVIHASRHRPASFDE